MPPHLAIGVVTMSHELLRLKRGKKADFKFISGFPSFRPGFSAAALRSALGKDFVHDAIPVLKNLLKSGSSVSDLVKAVFEAKEIFIAAALAKVDVQVLL